MPRGSVVELVEDIRVGALVGVGEETLGRGIGQADPAVGPAHDDGLAHRADDGVQLGGAGVLGLGEPLEPDLDLDALTDVVGDRDDPGRAAREVHVLDDELHGQRSIGPDAQFREDRFGLARVGYRRGFRVAHPGHRRSGHEFVEWPTDERVGRAIEERACPAVDVQDLAGARIEEEDRFGDRVQRRFSQSARWEPIGVGHPGWTCGDRIGDLDRGCRLLHGSSMIPAPVRTRLIGDRTST